MPWLNLSGRQRLPVIRQSTFADCGLACIAMIAAYYGNNVDLAGLRRRFGGPLAGAGLTNLIRTAESLHFSTRAVRCRLSELACVPQPCILHWGFDHFVVLRKAHRSHLMIHDPACGELKVPFGEADTKFTGVALELAPGRAFAKRRPSRRLKLTDLIVADSEFGRGLSSALLLAVVSELLLLATPFYLQVVIDQVLMRGDHRLLPTLALGFALLAIFQLAAGVLRQLTFQFLSQSTMFSLSSRVLRHLMHLPVSWFRARRSGDVQQRMHSLAGIQVFVTQSAPALVLDCIFLLIVMALMFVYAPALAFIAIIATGVYMFWRVLVFPLMLELTNKVVRAEAAVQSHLLESLRGMQSIKMCAGEAYRITDWRNLLARRINMQIRAGNLGIVDAAVHQGIFQGLHIAIVFLLAQRVQAGEMSVGTLSAFVAYCGMYVTRAGGITNRIFEYHLLRVPLGRLEDIVFNDVEVPDYVEADHPRLTGKLRVSGVAFSYPGADSAVLDNITFDAACGEMIAVHGHSGGGKSTLLRLLGGIEQPGSGRLCYDGRPVADWPQESLRRDIATVFHDDVLLAGSIADNIALFDPERDDQRIHKVADLAAVSEAVEALPMAYETPIGDLGSILSTGQVQRILFARALYRRPSLLLLDEFTSALDADTERRVLQSLLRLPITRIVVSHSSAVLRAADRVYELRDGRLLTR